jgi:hemolysin-activating ACP:hemolysin acyltransferase
MAEEKGLSDRLEVGALNDANISAVAQLVSAYPPFFNYSFGLMMPKLMDQLRYGANVMVIHNHRLVAYTGWIIVHDRDAVRWLEQGGDVPNPDWQHGDAGIVTVAVSVNKMFLPSLIRAISHVCAGKKVYRMRSFQDGRQDMRRPAIVGRPQHFGPRA